MPSEDTGFMVGLKPGFNERVRARNTRPNRRVISHQHSIANFSFPNAKTATLPNEIASRENVISNMEGKTMQVTAGDDRHVFSSASRWGSDVGVPFKLLEKAKKFPE
jgi:hypothetical protein